MRHVCILTVFFSIMLTGALYAQETGIPVKWEELTTPDFIKAVKNSGSTCIIPIGVLEKHGAHLPLGTDVMSIREIAVRAAKQDYAIVFPYYYAGQINVAKPQPGTVAYSQELQLKLLQETCDELGRNGIKNIIIANGHGGNTSFLSYFCRRQLENRRDYAVLIFRARTYPETDEKIKKIRKTTFGGHADEEETSTMLVTRPDLTHVERANEQSGESQGRFNLPYATSSVDFYDMYPNHYAGDGSPANVELGNLIIEDGVSQLVELIKAVKKDDTVHKVLKEFYDKLENPLETKQ
ncbi:creatininase family protein [Candidatus Latescibacterota bacterium]